MEESTEPYRYRVRKATEADFPRLVELGRHFAEQTAYNLPYSEAGAQSWFKLMLDHGLLFVGESDHVIGVIGGAQFPFIINPEYGVGSELVMWIEPEHRGSGLVDMMMDAIENAARDAGLAYWSMMSLEAVRPEVAHKLYTRRGYRLAEHTYLKDLS